MRNKYGGKCYRCGEYVKPNEGFFERNQGGWRVHHVECCHQARKDKEQGATTCQKQP